MNTDHTTESTQSISLHSTFKLCVYYTNKLYNEEDPIMKKVYYNTLIRLLDGQLEATQVLPKLHNTHHNG